MVKDSVKLFVLILLFCSGSSVIVERLQLPYEQIHTLQINDEIEFILDFQPTAEQSDWPIRIFLESSGADTARPLLVTVRQITGAVTWQLPWSTQSGHVMYRLEKTLCPADRDNITSSNTCDSATGRLCGVTLHISSSSKTTVSLTLTVNPDRQWHLPFQTEVTTQTDEAATKSYLYTFRPDQENVRLILSSEDNVCATISVQNYSCPLVEDEIDAQLIGQRMTMMRSGAFQLSRNNYPVGFYIVLIVRSTDIACTGEVVLPDEDWLWDAMWHDTEVKSETISRTKTITLRVEPALTRGQYAIASVVTAILFLSVYLVCLVFILAQKYEPFHKLVAPLDPPDEDLQNEEETQTEIIDTEAGRPGLRRRNSNATLDSSNNSDSETDDPDQESPSPVHPHRRDVAFVTAAVNSNVETEHNERQTQVNQQEEESSSPNTIGIEVNSTEANGTELNGTQQNGTGANGTGRDTPFGLPPELRLATLSRHRSKVLRARSDRYLWTLLTVAVFYGLPVLQFVTAFQILMNVSGSLDICYYNFLCAHPAGQISDFNHIYSNLGYLLLGGLFIVQVYRRKMRRQKHPRKEEYGIPPHYGLLNALGAGMMVVAFLSASYHVCPNRLNFQFDTAFMYVLAVVMMVKIYQSRHPDVNARAHATFGVLALIIALGVWGVLGGGALFWALFTVLHLFTFLLISLGIYYVGQFKLERQTLQRAARNIAALPKYGVQPLYKTRLVLLTVANCVNWAFALYGLWTQSSDFASHLLTVLLGNALMYMGFYLIMKLLHGERPRWYAWCFLAGAVAAWLPALYFFTAGSSSWSSTPAESRHYNHECNVLKFYDNHDLWHFLSAIALYLTFNALLTWDDGLTAVKRTEIAVF